jgi:AmmeMemoRadiSam system protein A
MGDKTRVVGYCSIAVSRHDKAKKKSFMLSNEDKRVLLEIARETIDTYIQEGKIHPVNNHEYSPSLQTPTGAFVTLHKNGKLRGCIGRFQPDKPLYEVVRDMAISASTKDYRFKPVLPDELDEIELEISVLTPLERINDPEEIQLGRHGIYIKKGPNSGTFLPQVASQTGWNLEEFLGHCSKDKAQIGWNGWKDAELFIYEALIFSEEEFHNL